MRYRATVAYDGTDFAGFQRLARSRTVQAVIEEVLSRIANDNIIVRSAGRTDAGVHATGQVIDFLLPAWRQDEATLQRALNAMLPLDVAVRDVATVPDSFHARYDASARGYIYTILNQPERNPLLARTTLLETAPLSAEAMNAALQPLLGEQDFASFGRATGKSTSTVRTLLYARVWREGALVRVGLAANGFLFRMVRSLVGSLLPIGRGDRPGEWLTEVLAVKHRSAAAKVVAPNGLCLVGVRYADSPPVERWFE